MRQAIRLAVLPTVFLASMLLVMPQGIAQDGNAGYSVHAKTTPSNPPAAQPQPQTSEPAPAAALPVPPTPEPSPNQQPSTANAAPPPAGPNAVGAVQGWDAQFGTAPPQTSRFTGTPEQMAVIEKINAYFNELKNLEGEFVQTDADDKKKHGRFYLERPGKVRFDYALPSRQKIISNGKYLAIEDHDLNTADRYPLDSTPFRLLLKDKVDLAQDANIVALDMGDNIAVITVQDKDAKASGQIRLFFDWPQLALKEWIVSDAQGLNTRIQLADLQLNKAADPKLFTFSQDIGMPKFRAGPN
jgi:outer membrane lipoprotein-sorting protein